MEGLGGPRGAETSLLNYKIGKTLGFGTFGKVKIAEHILTKQKVAIKILSLAKIRDMDMEEKVRREIKILRLFMHPHITRLYEVIETQTDIFLVMEYVNCGELFDYIVQRDRLREDEARRFFQQGNNKEITIIFFTKGSTWKTNMSQAMAGSPLEPTAHQHRNKNVLQPLQHPADRIVHHSGVEYCHRNMVVHRDLKPENLLLDSKYNLKIADFGLSNIMHDGHFLKTSCGSPNYAAPEVISGKLYAGPEVDVWSCGVILYALLCASLPFDDGNLSNLYKKIKGGMYTLPSHLSPGAKDLIARMLVVDPLKRITISKIQKHSWFLAHLPRYLAVPAPEAFQRVIKIDEDVLQEVVNMGFERSQLIDSLQNRTQNQGTVAYNLMLDRHFHLFNGYLGAEMQERNEVVSYMNTAGPTMPTFGYKLPSHIDQRDPTGHGLSPEAKWALGLQSEAHPRDIMREVLIVLQKLNVGWKRIGHYAMKCRWFPQLSSPVDPQFSNRDFLEDAAHDNPVPIAKIANGIHEYHNNVVKFEVQLFKTNEEKYLLDLQRVQGPHLLFLDLCAVFLSQLRIF